MNVKGSYLTNKNTASLSFRGLYTDENIIMNVIFHFCQEIPHGCALKLDVKLISFDRLAGTSTDFAHHSVFASCVTKVV